MSSRPPRSRSRGLDRSLHAILGRATRAISPTSLLLAYVDWWSHLALSPAKQAQLVQKALRKAHRLALYAPRSLAGDAERCIEPLAQDGASAIPSGNAGRST
jgi:polyhydroxyalkanoate synthase